MTDNEIKKALECCSNSDTEKNYCDGCPYDSERYCASKISKDTLDLINRQQAEIRCLIKSQKAGNDLIETQKAEIESLNSRIFALNDTNKKLMDSQEIYWQNKVKEFAYRLLDSQEIYWQNKVKEFAYRLCKGRVSNDPVVIAVKAELKEMVGED